MLLIRTYLFSVYLYLAFISNVVRSYENFTIVTLPDTQYYSAYFPSTYYSQVDWICQCREKKNIVMVNHLGDLVEHGNAYPLEWEVVSNSHNHLLGCNTPFAVLPGNHDVSNHRSSNPYYYFDSVFKQEIFEKMAWFGESSFPANTMRNTFQKFNSVNGSSYLFVNLEFFDNIGFNNNTIAWANGVISNYSDWNVLVFTHYAGSDCSDFVHPYLTSIIELNCNVMMAFGGHVYSCSGERINNVTNSCGRTVHVIISNYQGRVDDQRGLLRYYEFNQPDLICAYTYYPFAMKFEIDHDSYFSINATTMILGDGCPIRECKYSGEIPIYKSYISNLFLIGNITILVLVYHWLTTLFMNFKKII